MILVPSKHWSALHLNDGLDSDHEPGKLKASPEERPYEFQHPWPELTILHFRRNDTPDCKGPPFQRYFFRATKLLGIRPGLSPSLYHDGCCNPFFNDHSPVSINKTHIRVLSQITNLHAQFLRHPHIVSVKKSQKLPLGGSNAGVPGG